ncbi:MAG: asparagine synthetase B [Gemmatimonadota bacterium]|nr:MAG: asparagine synthetase B [Gemmatimonadota bacterium]
MSRRLALVIVVVLASAGTAQAQYLLAPMDGEQSNHLRAYGLAYWVLGRGERVEWLLNYRAGSFLLPDAAEVRREAALRGVSVEPVGASRLAAIRAEIDGSNMEAVVLEKAPRIAVYTPPGSQPWDDAVTLALSYAGIEYEELWDPEVLGGELGRYDWLHLHHEDFTGQYSKFYLTYAGAAWLQEEVSRNRRVARAFGLPDSPSLKKAVAVKIREYVDGGGFLFAMCTATETIDLALAALGVDIAASYADGDAVEVDASARLNWESTFAFEGAAVFAEPALSAFSDIDGHLVNTPMRQPLGTFRLFDFSATIDPVATMLTQNHERVIRDFYGLTTSYRRSHLKPSVTVLAEEPGAPWVKYLHGNHGDGTWTFLGGHDPEDPQHVIGDPPTDLDLYPHSPGYRLILNNVLFPAAKKRHLKT